jgi:hypothetical protein
MAINLINTFCLYLTQIMNNVVKFRFFEHLDGTTYMQIAQGRASSAKSSIETLHCVA